MRNNIIATICLALLVFTTKGQSSVTGPDCVMIGAEYQYSISPGVSGIVQVCVTGGSVIGGTNNCISGSSISTIRIIWNDHQTGSITLSGAAAGSKTISITKELQPGSILDSTIQIIQQGAVPATIYCSQASGGGCSASYSYQWQQSVDNVTWENINNATSQNLGFAGSISQATFYRRKVTNNVSNSVGYSDVATVFVIVQNQIARNSKNIQLNNFKAHEYTIYLTAKAETKMNRRF